MKLFNLLFSVLILGVLTSCLNERVVANSTALKRGFDYDVIDDGAYRTAMNKGVERLKKAGEIVDVNKLYEQLKRTHYKLILPHSKNQEKMSSAEIFDKYRDSVLLLGRSYKCKKCPNWHTTIASGFIISEDGVAVTNYHVMDKSRGDTLTVMTYGKKVYAISEVLAADKDADIAIIRITGKSFQPIPIASKSAPGRAVTSITNPDGNFFSISQGIISRYYKEKKRSGVKVSRMAITADFAKGSSGGPIFNEYGELAGMVSYTRSIYYNRDNGIAKNLQMVIKGCVPSSSILKLIEN